MASIILSGGYVVMRATGILDPGPDGGADAATPTPAPTSRPVVAPTMIPEATPGPTPIVFPVTPTPTPVPPKYSVSVDYMGDASSRTYTVRYTLKGGSAPIDMGNVDISVWQDGIVYQNSTYSHAQAYGASWSNANGDQWLDPGETYTFLVNGYSLNIAPDTEPRVTFILNGEVLRTTTLAALINPDLSGMQPVDPEATINPYGY